MINIKKNIFKLIWYVIRFEVLNFGIKILKRYWLFWVLFLLIYWIMNLYVDGIFIDFYISRYSLCFDVVWEEKWVNGKSKFVKFKKYKLENMSRDSFFVFVVFYLVKYNRFWSINSEFN